MTTPADPIPTLLSSDDLALFQASDPDWFLNAAGETVRWDICQWHVAPSVTVTKSVPIQPDGTIMLPSLYVTAVSSITIDGLALDPASYEFETAGYIKRVYNANQYFQWPLWPIQSEHKFREYPSPLAKRAAVTFTHGYPTVPAPVAVVAYELAARAMEMPAGVANQIASGPYTIGLGALGIVPTDDQRRRLGPFTLVRF